MRLDHARDQEGVDQSPDAQANEQQRADASYDCHPSENEKEQLGNAGAGTAQIEAMCTKRAEEEPEEVGHAGRLGFIRDALLDEYLFLR